MDKYKYMCVYIYIDIVLQYESPYSVTPTFTCLPGITYILLAWRMVDHKNLTSSKYIGMNKNLSVSN